jgi:hypothetical protein
MPEKLKKLHLKQSQLKSNQKIKNNQLVYI